jgi:hypothetical protein
MKPKVRYFFYLGDGVDVEPDQGTTTNSTSSSETDTDEDKKKSSINRQVLSAHLIFVYI